MRPKPAGEGQALSTFSNRSSNAQARTNSSISSPPLPVKSILKSTNLDQSTSAQLSPVTLKKPLPIPPTKPPSPVPSFKNENVELSPKSQKLPTVLVVGCIGAGKSALCNYLHDLGDSAHLFAEANPAECSAVTLTVSRRTVIVKNSLNFNGYKFQLIDTPGITANLSSILLQTLRNAVDEITNLVLVVPYDLKVDQQSKGPICCLRDAFSVLFRTQRVCVVLTRMSEENFEQTKVLPGGYAAFLNKCLQDINKILGILSVSVYWH